MSGHGSRERRSSSSDSVTGSPVSTTASSVSDEGSVSDAATDKPPIAATPTRIRSPSRIPAAAPLPPPPAAASSRPRPERSRTSTMNGPLYMQTSGKSRNVVLVRRLKRKDEGSWRSMARWLVENQIGLSFNIMALLFLTHLLIPKARTHTHKFFALSYPNAATGQFGAGGDDAYLTVFCIVLFTGLRAGTMEYVLAPLGKMWGVANRKDLTRFSEQAWMLLYYIVFWSTGMYIYYSSKWFLSMKELWTDWPSRELDGLMKSYVLAQLAFWLQQVLVINIEERRKDHWQMLSHHFITISLIVACYGYHHTRVGNLVLVLMDVIDLFLPLAKCFRYVGLRTLCDVTFGIFMVSWVIARHVLYLAVCWSVYADSLVIITGSCYSGSNSDLVGPFASPPGYRYLLDPFIDSRGRVCYDWTVMWAFLGPLLALQVLTIGWFAMIVRVAVRVVRGGGADDTRSDGEDEEDEEDEFVYEEAAPLEQEVGVEALDLKNWERRSGVKRAASASGVSLPGHSDRKELLGRIGCDKHVD